jgi:2-polyprenyl-3-methyl-5-hydroxy-6-metoxy-1,4-benzoquinol methylase
MVATNSLGQKGVVRLFRCGHCQLVFADRTFWSDPHAGADYYSGAGVLPVDYPILPNATDADRMSTVVHGIAKGKFLDYGGGLGSSAIAAQSLGFDATVLEDSEKAVADGQKYHPDVRWIQGKDMTPFSGETFDVITLFHVLEHIVPLYEILSQLSRAVRPGGWLVIEVPNWASHMRKLRGLDWQFLLDHHVNYFDRHSLKACVEPHGFHLERVELRRTFCINERQPWKEPIKRLLCALGFGEIVRATFRRQ